MTPKQHTTAAWVAVTIALLSLLFSGSAGYAHNDKQIESRLTALETNRTNDSERLHRVENKLDQLVEWALGKQ